MSDYRMLCSLEVIHEFYASPSRTGLQFVPSPDASAWLRRTGSFFRASGGRLDLFAPPGVLDDASSVALTFSVQAADPLFVNVTPALTGDGGLARFDSGEAELDTGTGRWLLGTAATGITAMTGGEHQPVAALPAFEVVLRLTGHEDESRRNFALRLHSRVTFWKYVLVGGWAVQQPMVVDLDQMTEFGIAEEVLSADRTPALAICSLSPLPLQEHSNRRFQLRNAAGAVLVQRLPTASASSLVRESIAGRPALVSEIFVHR
ncbi:hypothetical protein [Rubrivivax albus]|uniref:Uncharacterized protein n=1 Tax=Rubrivivax albus TaxID=2499835 RepID=A0A3S2WSQ5_9BURK|nr:hypothetical protein [Rubrivivax albus]RVT49753.1 hypothetical protein ENE75_19125 [Rubrivivax albus]